MTFGNEIPEIVIIIQGDTEPLSIYLKNQDGTAYDLTNASAVAFYMAKRNATSKTAGGACSIESPATDGLVKYTWGANETDTVGEYLASCKITLNTGKIRRTYKFTIIIEEKIPET